MEAAAGGAVRARGGRLRVRVQTVAAVLLPGARHSAHLTNAMTFIFAMSFKLCCFYEVCYCTHAVTAALQQVARGAAAAHAHATAAAARAQNVNGFTETSCAILHWSTFGFSMYH